jgi:hypothetical protein
MPEIDIWRAASANGDKAEEQSAGRAEDLTADGDHEGAATWRRINDAVRLVGSAP